MSSSNQNQVQSAIEAGARAAGIAERMGTIGTVPVSTVPLLVQHDVINAIDRRAATPRRRVGSARVTDRASFIALVNRIKDEHSAIFANDEDCIVTAVIDYNQGGAESVKAVGDGSQGDKARWGQHRIIYSCPLSDAWKLWGEHNEKWMKQDTFASFIEDNMKDLAGPSASKEGDQELPAPSDVLTMARKLVVNTAGIFSRTVNPVTGEFELISKTEHLTTSTKIHKAFKLGIPVFRGGDHYAVFARIRMNLESGNAKFCYSLYESDVIKRTAFVETCEIIKGGELGEKLAETNHTGTGLPVFYGAPES